MNKKKVLIIEDEMLIAKDLSFMLEDMGYECVGIANSYERAMYFYNSNSVDLLLCDINIEGKKDGIDTAKELVAIKPAPIIYLSAHSDDSYVKRALETVPAAYLIKPYNERSLQIAITMALQKFEKPEGNSSDFIAQFTKRELDVIQLLAIGKSTIEIADILILSEFTVGKHRSNILRKSGCKSTTELINKYHHNK